MKARDEVTGGQPRHVSRVLALSLPAVLAALLCLLLPLNGESARRLPESLTAWLWVTVVGAGMLRRREAARQPDRTS
jgi:hypothetical protein